jgi:hypothetical protein
MRTTLNRRKVGTPFLCSYSPLEYRCSGSLSLKPCFHLLVGCLHLRFSLLVGCLHLRFSLLVGCLHLRFSLLVGCLHLRFSLLHVKAKQLELLGEI